MKKTGFVVLALVFLFTLPSWAMEWEIYSEDESAQPAQQNNIVPDLEDVPAPQWNPRTCSPDDTASAQNFRGSCDESERQLRDKCSRQVLNQRTQRLRAADAASGTNQVHNAQNGTASIQSSAEAAAASQTRLNNQLGTLARECTALIQNCVSVCDRAQQSLNQFAERTTNCSEEVNTFVAQVFENRTRCEETTQIVQDLTKQQTMTKITENDGQRAKEQTSASADGSTSGGDTAAADTTTSDSAEETPKKKSSGLTQSDASTLMGAATSLLGAFMAPKPEEKTMAPAELAAQDCRRPENMGTLTCRCQIMWTSDCNGSGSASQDFGSNALPGVGGAALNKEQSPTLSLPNPDPIFEVPKKNDFAGGGNPAGMYGGGGGVNPSPANFKPDAPAGKGGSSLSSGIFNGTYGGNAMTGMRGGPGMRPSMNGRRAEDPEDMRGYMINKKGETPDFNKFLPPGAGQFGKAGQIHRGLTGADGSGPSPMHPANADIFRVVTDRYFVIWDSLYP